uniref:(northern house mosquito) hypothetical protein n=1 Tax=Culex pipiens TaxID=7175 RepID=A0A8D8K7R4_CULPI
MKFEHQLRYNSTLAKRNLTRERRVSLNNSPPTRQPASWQSLFARCPEWTDCRVSSWRSSSPCFSDSLPQHGSSWTDDAITGRHATFRAVAIRCYSLEITKIPTKLSTCPEPTSDCIKISKLESYPLAGLFFL